MTARPRLRRLSAILVGTIAALMMVEAGLRAGARWVFVDNLIRPDQELGWSLFASSGAWAMDEHPGWVTTNSFGYRDREHPIKAAPGTLRIAVIGDSFIHAYFLDLDNTFGANLERALGPCRPGRNVEVLNFGVLNYNTTQEWLTYRRDAARFSPDIVVLAAYAGNDVFDNHPQISTEPAPRYVFVNGQLVLDTGFRAQLPARPAWPWRRQVFESLVTRWQTLRLVNDTISRLRSTATQAPDRPEREANRWPIYQPPPNALGEEAWALTEAVIKGFATELASRGTEFWLLPVFTPEQVTPDGHARAALATELHVGDLFYPTRRLESFALREGLHVIPVAEPVAAYSLQHGVHVMGGSTREVPPGTGHWNALGTRLAAEIAARQMCAESQALAAR